MSHTLYRSTQRTRRAGLHLEPLEAREVPSITLTSVQGPSTTSVTVPVATEGAAATPALQASFTDTNTTLGANQYTVAVNYGDGTAPVTNATPAPAGTAFDANLQVTGSAGSFTITDTHTFPEESGSTVPPFAFPITVTVTEAVANGTTGTGTGSAQVLDAALSPGDPVTPVSAGIFTGGNTGNATTAAAALANFEATIGGPKNTAPAPQQSGFRTITWDGVKVDGTDSVGGPNSTTVITPGHTVGIPLDRFQGQGVFFGAVYAVSNDGFVDTNPNVAGLFPAFSPKNTFAMFNDNGIDFKFVAPSATNTALVSAAARGFGAVFQNVMQSGTTIQFFHGGTLLDTVNVPAGGQGSQVFAGELFSQPIVTNVLLTLGNGVIFKFDGTTLTPGGTNGGGTNLVTVDDWAFAEPVPITNGFPITSGPTGTNSAPPVAVASVGRTFSGVVATFSDADPNGNARDFTATINWGDGHLTNGTIAADGKGGFTVSGTNTYTTAGQFPVSVDVFDFGGGPGVGGSQSSFSISNSINVLDANHSFVQALFNDFLGRNGAPAELDMFVNLLPGLGQGGVASAIAHSPEGLTHTVDGLYAQLLGRQALGGEEQGFVRMLENGATQEQVTAEILSSQEFASRANTLIGGTSADANFVGALFKVLLNRTAGTDEVNTFLGLLPAQGRAGTAEVIEKSPEFRGDVATGTFATLLDRTTAPSSAEVATLVDSGKDLLSLEVAQASTSEYFQNG
jgi:hypothetical protein